MTKACACKQAFMATEKWKISIFEIDLEVFSNFSFGHDSNT